MLNRRIKKKKCVFIVFCRAFLCARSPACMCWLLIERPLATHGVACTRNDVRADCPCNSKTDMDIQSRRECERWPRMWTIGRLPPNTHVCSSLCDLGPRNARHSHNTHSPTFHSDVGVFFSPPIRFVFSSPPPFYCYSVDWRATASKNVNERRWSPCCRIIILIELNWSQVVNILHTFQDFRIEIVIFHVCARARASRCRCKYLRWRLWAYGCLLPYVCGCVYWKSHLLRMK